jgi:hypothetical protein
MSLRSTAVARRRGTLPPEQAHWPRLLAEFVAAHFRNRAQRAGLAPERYALHWTESRISHRTGERSERDVALFRWQEAPGRGVFIHWGPDQSTLREHWPGEAR